jgi:hypothetical protein
MYVLLLGVSWMAEAKTSRWTDAEEQPEDQQVLWTELPIDLFL